MSYNELLNNMKPYVKNVKSNIEESKNIDENLKNVEKDIKEYEGLGELGQSELAKANNKKSSLEANKKKLRNKSINELASAKKLIKSERKMYESKVKGYTNALNYRENTIKRCKDQMLKLKEDGKTAKYTATNEYVKKVIEEKKTIARKRTEVINEYKEEKPKLDNLEGLLVLSKIEALEKEVDKGITKTEPTGPEPTNPEPTNPEPINPEPINPEPINPEPINPEPINPEPINPEPINPEPINPEPINPEPINPEPTNPEPTNPGPTNPEPTNPEPTFPEPTYPAPITGTDKISRIEINESEYVIYFEDENKRPRSFMVPEEVLEREEEARLRKALVEKYPEIDKFKKKVDLGLVKILLDHAKNEEVCKSYFESLKAGERQEGLPTLNYNLEKATSLKWTEDIIARRNARNNKKIANVYGLTKNPIIRFYDFLSGKIDDIANGFDNFKMKFLPAPKEDNIKENGEQNEENTQQKENLNRDDAARAFRNGDIKKGAPSLEQQAESAGARAQKNAEPVVLNKEENVNEGFEQGDDE